MEPYIVLDGVSKSFRSVEVLKPLSIEFEEGLIHGIVGRNGSGKTVMMKLILGFLKRTGYHGKAKVNYFGRADEWTG